jgi:predicted patatin/cPLA2 family phospholipase
MPSPVVDILLDRAAGRSGPLARTALVIQGGAMRGVFTAGALCALEALGLRAAFDAVYGSSAGAVNGAYFLTGQVTLGTSIYYEDINNRTFIDWRRLAAGAAVDIDYCYEEVVGRRKRLDLPRLLHHSTPLHVYTTHVAAARAECFAQADIASPRDLLTLLKASAAMPLVYRRPVLLRGTRHVDGALFVPVPLLEAIAGGATRVLVLLSRPLAAAARTPQAAVMPLVLSSIDRRQSRALARAWAAGQERLRAAVSLLAAAAENDAEPQKETGGGVHLAVIAPPPVFRVTRWTTDRAALLDAAALGAERTLALFGAAGAGIAPRAVLGPEAAG